MFFSFLFDGCAGSLRDKLATGLEERLVYVKLLD